jgi:hypothetical protein
MTADQAEKIRQAAAEWMRAQSDLRKIEERCEACGTRFEEALQAATEEQRA